MFAEQEMIPVSSAGDNRTKTISVLFTTYTDFVSRLVGLFSGFRCTHVSISTDENDEYFYAFNTKGFRKEYPRKHRKRTQENVCLRLSVTDEQYKKIKGELKRFENKKGKLSYDYLGIFAAMFRLPIKRKKKNKYFCSSFMAELLEKANILKLKKRRSSRYLPYHLQKELLLCTFVIGIAQNIFIA